MENAWKGLADLGRQGPGIQTKLVRARGLLGLRRDRAYET
jgi:hypothetical protein